MTFQHQHDDGFSTRTAHEVTQLFESRTIDDIRKTESLTRKEVEDKRQELRKLIGARYRDLISSADAIVTMKQQADLLFASLNRMSGNVDDNAVDDGTPGVGARKGTLPWANIASETTTRAAEDKKKQAASYTTAGKIKSVLETPEHIWAALERSKHLEATLLYHQAQLLYTAMRADSLSSQAMDAMPVVPRQWAVICQFPPTIDVASKEFLTKPDQPPDQYAATLCALAILEKPVPSQIFATFLAARTQLLEHTSRASIQSHQPDAIVQRLCNCAHAITSTFFLIFYMFVCPTSQPNPKNPKFLPTAVHKDSVPHVKHPHLATHLHATTPPTPPYFYSILQTLKDDIDAIYKTHTLDQPEHSDSEAFFSLHIPSSSIHTQCEQWLNQSTQCMQGLTRDVLAHVNGAQVLAQVRGRVRDGLNEAIEASEISWSSVCKLVIGRELDLWDAICMDPFAARAREIVAHSFKTVDFSGALSRLLKTPSVGVGQGIWCAESVRDEKETVVIQNKAAGLTSNVSEFVHSFDTMLAMCLADLAHLTQPPTTPSPAPSSHPQPSPRIPSSPRIPPSPRISPSPIKPTPAVVQESSDTLEVYVRDRCFDGVSSFLGEVRKRLEVLQASIFAATTSANVQQTTPSLTYASPLAEGELRNWVDEALLIAQAGRALSSYSKQLSAAMAPPNTTTTLATPSPYKTKVQVDKLDGPGTSRIVSIKAALRQCYLYGYVLWAKWVTVTHTQWLASCIARDSWSDSSRRQGWEEHKVTIEGDDGAPVEEKLYLPFQPSPYVLEFLFAVCREIHRAGGHTIHRTALEYLARELAQAVLELYDEVARTHQGATSKEGGVQLLCDACFLVDVLSVPDTVISADADLRGILATLPRAPSSDSPASEANEVTFKGTEGRLELAMAWGRRVDKTVSTLKELLDPIDLAFYEPHVKSFVVRCYHRCSVMFGAIIQLHRTQDSHTKVPPVADPNIVPLAKPTARFGYLPTSVPAPTSHNIIPTPTKLASHADGKEQGSKKLSFMEQGVGSLKKITSFNMLTSQFTSPTSPQPTHSTSTSGLSTTPPKPGTSSLWSLLG